MRKSIRSAWPAAPASDASWSSSPVCAPTQSFSTREHSRASSTRSAARSSPASAEQREAQRDLQRGDRRQPGAARHVAGDRSVAGRTSCPPPASSATVPRTNARQPSARARSASAKRSSSPEVAGPPPRSGRRDRLGAHRHAVGDRERQREAAVVVGVLADQVDAAGAAGRRVLRHTPTLLSQAPELAREEPTDRSATTRRGRSDPASGRRWRSAGDPIRPATHPSRLGRRAAVGGREADEHRGRAGPS